MFHRIKHNIVKFKYRRKLIKSMRKFDEIYKEMHDSHKVYLEKDRENHPLSDYYKGKRDAMRWMFK